MEANRREALLQAMIEELAAKGYHEASVAAAAAAANVSEGEFAADFKDKDDCLLAAYDFLGARILTRVRTHCDPAERWPERVRNGLAALLWELGADPKMAQALTRTFPGIRPATYQRYVELLSRFVPFMSEGRAYSEVDGELPGEVELLAVGAGEAIIFSEIDAGRAEQLPSMLPEILFSILVPFMGPERAADEMRIASAAT